MGGFAPTLPAGNGTGNWRKVAAAKVRGKRKELRTLFELAAPQRVGHLALQVSLWLLIAILLILLVIFERAAMDSALVDEERLL